MQWDDKPSPWNPGGNGESVRQVASVAYYQEWMSGSEGIKWILGTFFYSGHW